MQDPSIKLQILNYIKINSDCKRLVSYSNINKNIKDTSESYIATALNRLLNERLVFHMGTEGTYGYGITAKGLEYLKNYENKQEVSRMTKFLMQISGLSK
jgi:DNA-binding PadR family transcriptional regulator